MTAPNGGPPPEPDRNSDAQLGGADAVEKTTYNARVHGADVGTAADRPPDVTAAVRHGRGGGPIVWIGAVIAVLVLLAYAAGLFS